MYDYYIIMLGIEGRKGKMKKKKNIWQWIFVIYCFLLALTFGFTFGSLLVLICGVAALPIQPVRDLWNEYLPNRFRWVKRTIIIGLFCISMAVMPVSETEPDNNVKIEQSKKDLSSIGTFSGKPYVTLNDNKPTFAEVSTKSFEQYTELDSLGRCGTAYACVGKDIMPTEERGSIGPIKPTGWHTIKYDIVDGKYLYNRCHLIGYQLTGENANEENLITGTRYLNIDGMLPFENMVADYVQETGNHVMYRVTPHFIGNNLLASGVQMEGYSVEDNGAGVCFNVYAYNAQPGININYENGESSLATTSSDTGNTTAPNDDTNNMPTNSDDTTLVWLSETGDKYHTINDCGNMNPNKARQVTKVEAERKNKKPCSDCH